MVMKTSKTNCATKSQATKNLSNTRRKRKDPCAKVKKKTKTANGNSTSVRQCEDRKKVCQQIVVGKQNCSQIRRRIEKTKPQVKNQKVKKSKNVRNTKKQDTKTIKAKEEKCTAYFSVDLPEKDLRKIFKKFSHKIILEMPDSKQKRIREVLCKIAGYETKKRKILKIVSNQRAKKDENLRTANALEKMKEKKNEKPKERNYINKEVLQKLQEAHASKNPAILELIKSSNATNKSKDGIWDFIQPLCFPVITRSMAPKKKNMNTKDSVITDSSLFNSTSFSELLPFLTNAVPLENNTKILRKNPSFAINQVSSTKQLIPTTFYNNSILNGCNKIAINDMFPVLESTSSSNESTTLRIMNKKNITGFKKKITNNLSFLTAKVPSCQSFDFVPFSTRISPNVYREIRMHNESIGSEYASSLKTFPKVSFSNMAPINDCKTIESNKTLPETNCQNSHLKPSISVPDNVFLNDFHWRILKNPKDTGRSQMINLCTNLPITSAQISFESLKLQQQELIERNLQSQYLAQAGLKVSTRSGVANMNEKMFDQMTLFIKPDEPKEINSFADESKIANMVNIKDMPSDAMKHTLNGFKSTKCNEERTIKQENDFQKQCKKLSVFNTCVINEETKRVPTPDPIKIQHIKEMIKPTKAVEPEVEFKNRVMQYSNKNNKTNINDKGFKTISIGEANLKNKKDFNVNLVSFDRFTSQFSTVKQRDLKQNEANVESSSLQKPKIKEIGQSTHQLKDRHLTPSQSDNVFHSYRNGRDKASNLQDPFNYNNELKTSSVEEKNKKSDERHIYSLALSNSVLPNNEVQTRDTIGKCILKNAMEVGNNPELFPSSPFFQSCYSNRNQREFTKLSPRLRHKSTKNVNTRLSREKLYPRDFYSYKDGKNENMNIYKGLARKSNCNIENEHRSCFDTKRETRDQITSKEDPHCNRINDSRHLEKDKETIDCAFTSLKSDLHALRTNILKETRKNKIDAVKATKEDVPRFKELSKNNYEKKFPNLQETINSKASKIQHDKNNGEKRNCFNSKNNYYKFSTPIYNNVNFTWSDSATVTSLQPNSNSVEASPMNNFIFSNSVPENKHHVLSTYLASCGLPKSFGYSNITKGSTNMKTLRNNSDTSEDSLMTSSSNSSSNANDSNTTVDSRTQSVSPQQSSRDSCLLTSFSSEDEQEENVNRSFSFEELRLSAVDNDICKEYLINSLDYSSMESVLRPMASISFSDENSRDVDNKRSCKRSLPQPKSFESGSLYWLKQGHCMEKNYCNTRETIAARSSRNQNFNYCNLRIKDLVSSRPQENECLSTNRRSLRNKYFNYNGLRNKNLMPSRLQESGSLGSRGVIYSGNSSKPKINSLLQQSSTQQKSKKTVSPKIEVATFRNKMQLSPSQNLTHLDKRFLTNERQTPKIICPEAYKNLLTTCGYRAPAV